MTQLYSNECHHDPCASAPHKGQIKLTVRGFTFHADKKMIPLLKALNDAGLQTYSHCAGHDRDGHFTPAWVVLELDDIYVDFRPKNGRTQLVLTWNPAWTETET